MADPERTALTRSPDGTMSTVGDMGYLDDDGFLYLTDRSTFMIISGGVNIYPQECENLLITHPKVADAAVFGVPHADLGEEVKAVVQPVAGVAHTPELAAELIAFCREHLAHLKCPRSIDFSHELPRRRRGDRLLESPDPTAPFEAGDVVYLAGTREAMDRMAVAAVKNVLSVFDGAPNVENVINKDVLA